MTVLVFLDPAYPQGRVADATAPTLMATDQGATRGDGIFDSMLAVNGKVRKLEAHLSRLVSSANIMELDIPGPDVWKAAITTALAEFRGTGTDGAGSAGAAAAAEQPHQDEAVVKLLATRGPEETKLPTCWIQVSAPSALGAQQRASGLKVMFLNRGYSSTVAQDAPWLLMGAKTLSYAVNMAALRHAHEHGNDDVIFTSSDGMVLEGPTSSVLMAHYEKGDDGTVTKRLITPQLDTGILPGTTQGALFRAAKEAGWELGYGPLVPEDLLDADAVWLISSIRLLAPVNELDGQAVGTAGVREQLTEELSALLAGIE
ncbi:MAG: aminodeoxychorismate lyase [Acidobacteria bacterium]|nr:aminodeoxychorismate lyase [Acidobacteriota bacterium]